MIEQIQFVKNWDKVYKKIYSEKQFGVRQSFAVEYFAQEDIYMINNETNKNKRPSPNIDIAFKKQNIKQPFDSQSFNFNKIKPSQTILQLQSQSQSIHRVIISGAPICQGHSLLVPFVDKQYPQILNKILLKQILRLLGRLQLPTLKICYNSQGAASTVNHFHAQLIQSSRLINTGEMPLQRYEYEYFFVGKDFQLKKKQKNKALYLQFKFKCLQQIDIRADVMMSVLDLLLKDDIPHNLIVANTSTVYLIIRGYALTEASYGFLQYSGIFILSNETQNHKGSILAKIQNFGKIRIDLQQIKQSIKLILQQTKQ